MSVRIHSRYTGRVQGVGFRATTQRVARDFRVTGWVRNNPDGSVSLEAQGEEAEVSRFLENVRRSMGECIGGEDGHAVEPVEDEEGFRVVD